MKNTKNACFMSSVPRITAAFGQELIKLPAAMTRGQIKLTFSKMHSEILRGTTCKKTSKSNQPLKRNSPRPDAAEPRRQNRNSRENNETVNCYPSRAIYL